VNRLRFLERIRIAPISRACASAATIALTLTLVGARPLHADPPDPKVGDYVPVEELPEALTRTAPHYPEDARRAGVTGTVLVQALVGRDGHVRDTRIIRSIPLLDQAAIDAVRQWVFKPAAAKGEPVEVWVAVPIKFSIDGRSSPTLDDARAPGPPVRTRVTPPRPVDPGEEFDVDLSAFHKRQPAVPSDSDAVLRGHVIHSALALPRIPKPTYAAFAYRDSARALMSGKVVPDSSTLARAIDLLGHASYEAPWWSEAYRDLGRALERVGRKADAALCLRLYLMAEPNAHDREEVQAKIASLEAH
jgi:TonB family protein